MTRLAAGYAASCSSSTRRSKDSRVSSSGRVDFACKRSIRSAGSFTSICSTVIGPPYCAATVQKLHSRCKSLYRGLADQSPRLCQGHPLGLEGGSACGQSVVEQPLSDAHVGVLFWPKPPPRLDATYRPLGRP